MEPSQTASGTTADNKTRAATVPGGSLYALSFGLPSSNGRIMLGADIEIFPDKPRPDLASGGTQAFEAADRRTGSPYLALLCPKNRGPRLTLAATYKAIKNIHLLHLHESGIVYWTPEDRQMFVLILDMPKGKKLMEGPDATPRVLDEDLIIPSLIRPMLSVLQELNAAGLVHGGIMPDNIFMHGEPGSELATLGEGLSTAAFYRHWPMCETPERAMAQPLGRGNGTQKNDLYALGVCIALAVRGVNPLAGKDADAVIRDKIEYGSYGSIAGRDRIGNGISDLLRGILHDDEAQRWSLEECMVWLEGRQGGGSKQTQITLRASRPFLFRGEKFWDLRSIAMTFMQHVAEAATMLEKDPFFLWIKRNFEDKSLEERLTKALGREENMSRDKRVAMICLAIDPKAPVRYKDIAVMPIDGYGTSLAGVMASDEDIQPYAEILTSQMLSIWVNQLGPLIEDPVIHTSTFEKCRNFLLQKMPGYGMERVVYQLNTEAVCLSPAFRKYFVTTPGHLLLALEAIAKQPGRPENILDRHMIAFISIREPKMIDPNLGHLISRDRAYQLIGLVRTLAAIQKRFQVGSVPALGGWVTSLLAPAIEKYNDRDLRAEIQTRLAKLPDPGSLLQILELIDSNGMVQDDTQRFIIARQEYALLKREGGFIVQALKKRRTYGIDTGRQIAMLVSVLLATFCILGFLVLHFIGE